MSKKRKREVDDVDHSLARIYEELGDEVVYTRLHGAKELLTRHHPGVTDLEKINLILTRLFRGLCSSRKASRLGFSVALTEYLSEVQNARGASLQQGLPVSVVIDILESETVPEGDTSGQEERDHYFGRLFGAEAVIKSMIIVRQQSLVQWKRLLDLVLNVATRKPWLRQECGWILLNCVRSFHSSADLVPEDFVLDVVEKLTAHKMIRTPEGIAIWLEVKDAFPHAKLPKHSWKHKHPLAKKDLSLLSDILKDAKTQNPDAEDQSQGNATWTAQLHFAWDVVLARLYRQELPAANAKANRESEPSESKIVDFESFWLRVVDESLFAPTSSVERKHWGLLLLAKVCTSAPDEVVRFVFSTNVVTRLVNALKGDDRYLQRSAQKAIKSLQSRVDSTPTIAASCLQGLLLGMNLGDFDGITKTKTVEKLLDVSDEDTELQIADVLQRYLWQPGTIDVTEAMHRRKYIISLQAKFFSRRLLHAKIDCGAKSDLYDTNVRMPLTILQCWVEGAYFENGAMEPAMAKSTQDHIKERLATHFEQALKFGAIGRRLLREAVGSIFINERRLNFQSFPTPEDGIDPERFERQIAELVHKAWKRLRNIPYNGTQLSKRGVFGETDNSSNSNPELDDEFSKDQGDDLHVVGSILNPVLDDASSEGLASLYSLVLFQIYNGEAEAVEVLDELLVWNDQLESKTALSGTEPEDYQADSLVEILLTFASKPSKFMRRVTVQIFESFVPRVTTRGLHSLIRVLSTKESAHGQREMFNAVDENEEEDEYDEDEGSEASDVETVDSGVETASVALSSDSGSMDADAMSGAEDEEDAELAAFDAKLAAALGTRQPGDDTDEASTSGCSDTDMDDDQMMALDEKLTEVFRARQQVTNKNKEKKGAKDNVVNFKNRVLDLIEVYLKLEYLSPQSLMLIVPLLHLARKTTVKQLSDRSCNILNEFCKRCKGQNVPALGLNEEEAADEVMAMLRAVHVEAGLGASNAHASAASHASILLVKSLVNAGVDIVEIIDVYGETRRKQLSDKKCKVQAGLFTDWNNWCVSAREKLAE